MTDETTPEEVAADEPATEVAETATTETETVETETAEPTEAASEPAAAEAEPVAAEAESAEPTAADGLEIGSEAVDTPEEPRPAPKIRGKIDRFGTAIGTGRRKTSVARVRIKKGDGQVTINGRSLDEFFCVERDRKMVMQPLEATERTGKVDVWVRVNGGGTTGQTGAIVLGIARALQASEPELHYTLADNGFLTRDGRMVERKKYGFRKARRSFQFSKR